MIIIVLYSWYALKLVLSVFGAYDTHALYDFEIIRNE